MAKKTNDLVPAKEHSLSVDVLPEEYVGLGTETIRSEDTQIPFLRIVQSLSPVRQKGRPEYIPGIEEGDFYNTVTHEHWKGETGVTFVPVRFRRRYTEWWPRGSDKKGLVADHGSDDSVLERCTRDERGRNMTPTGTEIVQSAEYLVLHVDQEANAWTPCIISLAGTQLKKARQLNTRLLNRMIVVNGQRVRAPLFYSLWRATSQPESNESGAWMGWRFDELSPLPTLGDLGRAVMTDAAALYKASESIKTAPVDIEEL